MFSFHLNYQFMLNKIISFSIHNKLIIGMMVFALIIWGVYSAIRLPIDAVPDITNNQVQVITLAPTLAAQEVEQFITNPIELSIANIPDVIERRSISRFGISVITVVFEDDVDIYLARQLVNESLQEAEESIPEGLGTPMLAPITTGLGEIYHYVVHTKPGYEDKYSAMDLRTIQDWIIRRQLAGTPGVAEISGWGGYAKTYEIALNNNKLNSLGVTVSDIFESLEHNNQNTGGAYIEKGSNIYFIRGVGMVKSLEDIENIAVKSLNGVPIYIHDVADVKFGYLTRYGAVTRNGEGEVVAGIVLMLKGENGAEVIHNVKNKIEEIQKSLPEGVVIEPFIDRSTLVNSSIGTVRNNLLEGGLIVIFILILLLGNWRAGFIVASVIPLAMLFALGMMYLTGVSGNLMSLGAIDFGLIVDGAVIIVESVLFILHTNYRNENRLLSNDEINKVVFKSSSRMMNSATFGQIIILIVYLPILTLIGIEGKMFRPMAQTVGFAIIGALLLSLTYVPMMTALIINRNTQHKRNFSDKMMDFFQNIYQPAINFSLRNKGLVITISAILLATGIFSYSKLGAEFIPTLEEGDLTVEISMMQGTSLTQVVETFSKAEKILIDQFPEVIQVVTRIGSAEIPTDPMPIERGDMMVQMKSKSEWVSAETREEMQEKMEQALSVLPGVNIELTQPMQMRFNELMTGIRQDVAVKIYGSDIEVLSAKANEVDRLIRKIEGVETPQVEKVSGLPQITVTYNRQKIAQYGLHIDDINEILQTAFAGETAGFVFEQDQRFEMVVRLDETSRHNINDLKSLYIPIEGGASIPLSQVAEIKFETGPAQISHDNTQRRIYVGFNVRGRDVKSVVEDIQKSLDANLDLPPGYHITYGGQFENLQAANKRLSIAVPVALLLIFVLLYFTFRSIKQGLLIYTAIPFAAIGGVFALMLRDMPFSISAGVGFIALFGVAVLNGIVLIAQFNQLKQEGMHDVLERVRTGTKIRLRPVLMTAAVASLGFLPMAISTSNGAEVQKPLATVVIGGLISSTILTLIVLPVLYVLFDKGKRKINSRVVVLITVFILATPFTGISQSNVLTLDKAFEIALNNNLQLKSSQSNVDLQAKLKQTSGEIPKPYFEFEYSPLTDIVDKGWDYSIEQEIPFPTVFGAKSQLGKAKIAGAEFKLAADQNELKYQIHSVFDKIIYLQGIQQLLIREDSLLTEFVKSATVRFNTGEANLLEKLSAEVQQKELQNQLNKNRSEIQNEKALLKFLMNEYSDFDIAEFSLTPKSVSTIFDTASISNNPIVNYYRQQVLIKEKEKKLMLAEQLPDLTIGYFNTNIIGVSNIGGTEIYYDGQERYQGIQLGISIPLWFKPNSSLVQAEEINRQMLSYEAQSNYMRLVTQLQQAFEQYIAYQNSLSYYELTALENADKIVSNATSAYKGGDSDYLEYLQALKTNLQIQQGYLDAIYNLNQAAITIQYLLND